MIANHRRKMLLVLPRDNTYFYKGLFSRAISYAPLTLTTLAALVPKRLNFDIDIIDEGIQNLPKKTSSYDVVGITCVASSAPRAYELALKFRDAGSFVVLGGAHPTLNPKEAAEFADAVIVGYAEKTWPKLLQDFADDKPLEKFYYSTKAKILSSVIPARDKLPKGKYLQIPTVIASRGCRHSCTFCSIHKIWNRSACFRPVDEVIEEMSRLSSDKMIMLDPNIIADKHYAAELFEKMIPLKKKWGGLTTIKLAEDKSLLDLASRSGCAGMLIGFESVIQESLEECLKAHYSFSKYKDYIKLFHQQKISVLGCFVLGFDHDDESVFERTVRFIDETGIDVPRFAVLTPFPGTKLHDDYMAEGRILSDDLSLYDTEHVVFQPKYMSPERLQQGLYEVWKKTYRIKRIINRTRNMPWGRPLGLAVNMGFRRYAYKISKRNLT